MSCLHPAKNIEAPNAKTQRRKGRKMILCLFVSLCLPILKFNVAHPPGAKLLHELTRRIFLELRIPCLDTKEEPVTSHLLEARYVEHRVIRMGQAIERQHPKNRCQRSQQDRAFESHRYERGPTVERPPADVQRISDRRYPVT